MALRTQLGHASLVGDTSGVGVIALPLRSMLYVHEVNVPKLAEKYDWEFRTKHQLGVELLTWFMKAIRVLGVEAKVWLAVDGAYATRPFLKPTLALGSVVVSRLRKDANLRDLPPQDSHGNRIYGKNKISLAKRAGHREGWSTITSHCCGVEGTRQYKTFLATFYFPRNAGKTIPGRSASSTANCGRSSRN